MADRMHPQDLRALLAATIYGQGLQLIGGAQWQNVNDYHQTVADVDALLGELERTAKPEPTVTGREPQGPFDRVVPRDRVNEVIARAEGAESALALAEQAIDHERARVKEMEESAALQREAYELARSAAEDFRTRAEKAIGDLAQAREDAAREERERLKPWLGHDATRCMGVDSECTCGLTSALEPKP